MRIIGTAQDITHEKELDSAKTEFIALTSHQLRTPPTGIKWYTAMLLDEDVGKLNDAQRKYLGQVAYNNQRMVDVVDTVLNVSQIELGTFQNKPLPTDVCALIEALLLEFDFEIKGKNITLTHQYECGTEPIVIDPVLLRMMVQNLISNSVKYTPEGGRITLSLVFADEKLLIAVTDDGRGIPKEEFPNIFKKFFRASNVEQQYSRGTGLGLYIVKRMLDQINGTISFTSELGKGTTFSISIPATVKKK